jgi:uncharacterized DUF497 family protein
MLLYEWDPEKSESNAQKHGVRFSDAVSVFEDPRASIHADAGSNEERYLITGFDAGARLLVVVYTWRGPTTVRLISARKGIEEIPGVNSQGATREELLENLSSALGETLEMNRSDALSAADGPYEEVSIAS